MIKFVLIVWMFQSPGFNNALIGHIATQKQDFTSLVNCEAAAKALIKQSDRDVTVKAVCVKDGE